MDDLVENGRRYYYVVRAISAQGALSIGSSPFEGSPSVSEASAPNCREPSSVK
jgi:hypothetical protein